MGKTLHLKMDALVRDLVQAHRQLQEEHELLLVIWHDRGSRKDINLLEVFEGWPESGIGELDSYAYGPSATFPLPGRLHLTLAGPKDFREACQRGHPLILRARADGEIVFEASAKSRKRSVESLKKAFHGES